MKAKIFLITIIISLTTLKACKTFEKAQNADKRFIYTYHIDDTKENIWTKARNFIATSFRDSNEVFKVQDVNSGTLIGKGFVSWRTGGLLDTKCGHNYNIDFRAQNGKARLEMYILPNSAINSCDHMIMPNEHGMEQIEKTFNGFSMDLEDHLRKDHNF